VDSEVVAANDVDELGSQRAVFEALQPLTERVAAQPIES
jgi:hypothetical protein